MLSQLQDAPALQIHRQLEDRDSVWAAERPRAGHHATARLHLLEELSEHCKERKRRQSPGVSPGSACKRQRCKESAHLPFSDWPGCLAFTLWVYRFFSDLEKLLEWQQKRELLSLTQSSQNNRTSLVLWALGKTVGDEGRRRRCCKSLAVKHTPTTDVLF